MRLDTAMKRCAGWRLRPLLVACLWFSLLGWTPLRATHQKAAEITFTHVSGYTYRFSLVTYTFTQSEADRPELEINWGDGSTEVLVRQDAAVIPGQTQVNVYTGTHTYAGPGSYYVSMEDANRNGGVVNMPNSINTPMYVETLLVISPYLSSGNNSPVLTARPVDDRGCVGRRFIHNPGAYDPDGDSLSYCLVRCRTSGGEDIAGYSFPSASDTIYINERTGDLIWENPVTQGEYNVAILIREWRNGRLIGEITRDMQIVVQMCDNYPPDLICDDFYCVEAGQRLQFEPYALDLDGDGITIQATGEIIATRPPQVRDLRPLNVTPDSVRYEFVWQTELRDSRARPYGLYLKATDGGNPPLSDLKTVSVQVLAPAVRGLQADYNLQQAQVQLRWEASLSPHAKGYRIYRRVGLSDGEAADECRGGVGTDYTLIGTVDGLSDTAYIDNTDLASGMRYCYRVCAYFADGDESYASAPACVEIASYTPVFTQISVDSTDPQNGRMALAWRHLRAYDSVLDGYVYGLAGGYTPYNLHLLGRFPLSDTVAWIDTALNTAGHPYYYRLGLLAEDEAGGHGGGTADSLAALSMEYATAVYASTYLMAVPHSRRVELDWDFIHPWHNEYFTVYRQHPDSAAFAPVARVAARHYVDVGLENDRTYRYYVEGYGTYYNDSLPSPLFNRSNTVSAVPELGVPCPPVLHLQDSSCDPLMNTLAWSFELGEGVPDSSAWADCYTDVAYYKLYYKRYSEPVYEEVASVEEAGYAHEPDGYWACYYVTAVNEAGMESAASNTVYADNRSCFSYHLPNVFTPNGDGYNDTFRALPNQYVEGFRIDIYNRWGNPVYSSEDPKFEWNGRMGGDGAECSDGVYFYVVEFTVEAEGLNDKIYQSGSVTILR